MISSMNKSVTSQIVSQTICRQFPLVGRAQMREKPESEQSENTQTATGQIIDNFVCTTREMGYGAYDWLCPIGGLTPPLSKGWKSRVSPRQD